MSNKIFHTVICTIHNGNPAFSVGVRKPQSFPVEIDEDETVGNLKDQIRQKNPQALAGIDAAALILYKINAFGNTLKERNKSLQEEILRVDELRKVSSDAELDLCDTISDLFPNGPPPPRTYHILVVLSQDMKTADSTQELNLEINPTTQALIFKAEKQGTDHICLRTLNDNKIGEERNTPQFIRDIDDKLKAQRRISLEQKECFKFFLNGTLSDNFEVVDGEGDCSYNELVSYAYLAVNRSTATTMDGYLAKHKIGSEYFKDIAAYLCDRYTGRNDFKREAVWPFSFVGQVGGLSPEYFSYQPKSDYMFLFNECPHIIFEICSKSRQTDRYRMLLQGGLLVRVMNSQKKQGTFVAIAIYITDDFVAKRYLMYQPHKAKPDIKYIVEDFDLNSPSRAFQFFFELHNLPSAFPPDPELINARSHLDKLKQLVDAKNLPGFTSRRPKTSPNEPPGDTRGIFHDPSTSQQVSDTGYELLWDVPMEGWTPLNPLPTTVSRARQRSTGQVVILKLVHQDEFAIHSFLSGLKAPQNHTIPILETIPLDVENLIVLRREQVLGSVPISVLRTIGNSLAFQLLEGVRFLHDHNVAHLDLKPANIVITATKQLQLIDFSVSVLVSELESWIVGYRGTKGWAAPELEHDPDGEFQPIRADLWSSGRVLQYLSEFVGGKFAFADIMRQLLNRNPQGRPHLTAQNAPIVKLKREFPVEMVKKEGAKRKRLQHGRQRQRQTTQRRIWGCTDHRTGRGRVSGEVG